MDKKFLLFLVEGDNDKREIDALLHLPQNRWLLELYEPQCIKTNGDITSSEGINAKNIQARLNKELLNFRQRGVPFRNIKVHQIQEFVQIVDLDGAFIPDDNIVQGNVKQFEYTDDSIISFDVQKAILRNKRKADSLRLLCNTDEIGNVPYSIYYVSCNMDHLLFGQRSLSVIEKKRASENFAYKCDTDSEGMFSKIFTPEVIMSGGYSESWEAIQKDCCSLERRTNLNLFFSKDAKNQK